MEPSSLYYKVAPVSNADPGQHPLIVFLHGRGSNEDDLLELSDFLPPQFICVSIRASFPYEYGGYTWFGLDEYFAVNIDQLLESCEAIIRTMDEIKQKYPVDTSRLFLFGFSMGAMISMVLGLTNPGRFRGIVAHSGTLPQHDRLS